MKTLIATLMILVSPASWAYLTFLESGEMVPVQHYRVGFIPQLITNDSSGVNVDATIDTGWNDSMSSRFQIGTGKMDIHLGGHFKFVPIPDVDRQPAIGVRGSAWYARYKDESYTTWSVAPFLSKKVATDIGLLVPYIAIPFNYTFNKNSDFASQQFVIGSEYSTPKAVDMSFAAELGVDLKNSYSFIALYFSFQFDGNQGLPIR